MRACLLASRSRRSIGLDAAIGVAAMSRWDAARRYVPSLLRASVVTLVLSCLAMGLAVALGVLIATGRVYGDAPGARWRSIGYVELMRGTPMLLQLFVLYYGIAAVDPACRRSSPRSSASALNYAAYESEIYRAALEAVSVGQLEAARTLGLSERQVLTLVRGPQAFRLALAPMTNDFVALLKDSSLVSVLTVVELTKQTQIFATNLGSWVIPGMLCAALYLAMSLPLAALARRLERRWKAPPRMSDAMLQVARSSACAAARVRSWRASRFEVSRGELVAHHGAVGLGQDDHPARDRRARTVRRGTHRDRRRRALEGGARPRRPRSGRFAGKVGMVFQFHCLFEHLSALENVCLAPVHAHGVPPRDAERRGARAADGVRRRASRRRAAARALGRRSAARRHRPRAGRRSAGAADGRADGVARSRQENELGELLLQLRADGRTLVIATHDEEFARAWTTRILVLRDGVIHER